MRSTLDCGSKRDYIAGDGRPFGLQRFRKYLRHLIPTAPRVPKARQGFGDSAFSRKALDLEYFVCIVEREARIALVYDLVWR